MRNSGLSRIARCTEMSIMSYERLVTWLMTTGVL